MKQLLEEFKSFILKGNIVMIAVGLFMGAAFGELVTAITAGFINPLLGKIPGLGGSLSSFAPGGFGIGLILLASINFVAKAAVIFFVVVQPMNRVMAMMEKKAAVPAPVGPPPATLDDVVAAIKNLKN